MSLENNSNNSQSIKINNVLIWILALSPIIGELLRGFIIGMVYGQQWKPLLKENFGLFR